MNQDHDGSGALAGAHLHQCVLNDSRKGRWSSQVHRERVNIKALQTCRQRRALWLSILARLSRHHASRQGEVGKFLPFSYVLAAFRPVMVRQLIRLHSNSAIVANTRKVILPDAQLVSIRSDDDSNSMPRFSRSLTIATRSDSDRPRRQRLFPYCQGLEHERLGFAVAASGF